MEGSSEWVLEKQLSPKQAAVNAEAEDEPSPAAPGSTSISDLMGAVHLEAAWGGVSPAPTSGPSHLVEGSSFLVTNDSGKPCRLFGEFGLTLLIDHKQFFLI